MAHDVAAAREAFTEPAERHVLDFDESLLQAVYVHDVHGPWYVFALPSESVHDRVYCIRPLADVSVVARIEGLQTLDEADWLVRLAHDVLLPACADVGFRVQTVRGSLTVEPMDAEALAAAAPTG
ncbi:MAG: hypothetical protein H6737_08770 [Alphaproteobacteria bacterium]|nr:hypothetical protein [Alphaproteobacteria bacterium]